MLLDPNERSIRPDVRLAALAGLTAREVATWDPGMPRGPRILVPVDIQALVVPESGDVERADIAVRHPTGQGPVDPDFQRAPPPFTDLDPRTAGVYLHWALPDGLTAGAHERITHGGGGMGHRPLPDRWLVTRAEPGVPRVVRSWMVESDRGRATPLETWEPSTAKSNEEGYIPPASLTAVAGGDLAWAAIFDNVENRFGFYDDLDGVGDRSRPLTYTVFGWYSDPALDPLHLGSDQGGLDRTLTELGWFVAGGLAQPLRRAREREATRRAAGVRGTIVDPVVPDVTREVFEEAASVSFDDAAWWPRQSGYHGRIWGVSADGQARPDERPSANTVSASVGLSDVEALAAMVTEAAAGGAAEERLQVAFGYGLLDAFGRPDGLALLDDEVHQRGFIALRGGEDREETIMAGDPLPPRPQLGGPVVGGGAIASIRGIGGGLTLIEGDELSVRDEFLAEAFQDPGFGPRRPVKVRRSPPRQYIPADPVLVLRGLNRSLRHGYDGRFEPNERLACRISGDEISRFASLIEGDELLAATDLVHGAVPPEARSLTVEALLEDPDAIDDLAENAAAASGAEADEVAARLRAEHLLSLYAVASGAEAARLLTYSLKEGMVMSPAGWRVWRQPWVPLYLEWTLEADLDDDLGRWKLGEGDLEPGGPAGAGATTAATISGRSLLGPSAARRFAAAVQEALAEEDRRDAEGKGRVAESDEAALRGLAAEADRLDLTSASLEGLREHLLGFDANASYADEGDEPGPVTPARPPRLVRAGTARMARLRTVDAFGRTLELPVGTMRLEISDSLTVPAAAAPAAVVNQSAPVLLPARLNAPTRLNLRLVDGGGNDDIEVTIDQRSPGAGGTPVAAWLLPDHADAALEVFDAAGTPLGQLRHDAVSGGVIWEGSPGRPGPVGSTPDSDVANRHAAALAMGLIREDAVQRAAEVKRSESTLSALLRVIDTTRWTIDPFGRAGSEHLALLMGHPIAVVRAMLRLQVESDVDAYPDMGEPQREARAAVFQELKSVPFDVQLGSLAHTDDGLLGYFVDDDYSRFFPVHATVVAEALPSGPQQGFLGTPNEAKAVAESLDQAVAPIEQPYVEPDPTVTVHVDQTVRLTLLMDPTTKVHVTSGIVPRKDITLLRDWVGDAMRKLIPSVRVGPVLVDPLTIRMPRPVHLDKHPVWSRRSDPTTWRNDPIQAATQAAGIAGDPAVLQEGYLRAEDPPG